MNNILKKVKLLLESAPYNIRLSGKNWDKTSPQERKKYLNWYLSALSFDTEELKQKTIEKLSNTKWDNLTKHQQNILKEGIGGLSSEETTSQQPLHEGIIDTALLAKDVLSKIKSFVSSHSITEHNHIWNKVNPSFRESYLERRLPNISEKRIKQLAQLDFDSFLKEITPEERQSIMIHESEKSQYGSEKSYWKGTAKRHKEEDIDDEDEERLSKYRDMLKRIK
ncbi:MAG: hypothetical protein QXG00_07075 [Candidatus Woesearchaeota archaeon]